jgi:hypothetical protein
MTVNTSGIQLGISTLHYSTVVHRLVFDSLKDHSTVNVTRVHDTDNSRNVAISSQ